MEFALFGTHTSSPQARMTSNQRCAMVPNSPGCSRIQASMAGSRVIALGNRISWLMREAGARQDTTASDQPSALGVLGRAMKRLVGGVVVSLACSAPLIAQERDRSIERISLALEQPPPIVSGPGPMHGAGPKRIGPFTLIQPTGPGEIVRVSVPIGEFVSRAFKGVAAANQRRQEAAARRRVNEELRRR